MIQVGHFLPQHHRAQPMLAPRDAPLCGILISTFKNQNSTQ